MLHQIDAGLDGLPEALDRRGVGLHHDPGPVALLDNHPLLFR